MIYTLTFNPALDYTLRLPTLKVGETNRSSLENLRLGGKGLNVSAVVAALGEETVAFAFAAGAIGNLMKEKGVEAAFPIRWFKASGESRINLKIKAEQETEINARGAQIDESELEKLKANLGDLQAGDFLVLAGSLPTGTRRTLYAECMQWVKEGVNCVVDTTGETLKAVLPHRPFLVKPNAAELGELFGVEIENKAQAVKYAKELVGLGARRVIVSMGGDGAVFVSEDGEEYQTHTPKGVVKDSVGAGDSVVAGFLCALEKGEDERTAFLTGVAAGSATAFLEGFATKEKVEELLQEIK